MKKRHNTKQQLRFILDALFYVVQNWRGILAVYGTLAALIATLGTFILNKIVIPSIKPAVRPIVKQYTVPNKVRLDSLSLQVDTLKHKMYLIFRPIE